MGELGILRLCGWMVIIMEWLFVVVLPAVCIAVAIYVLARVICKRISRVWYDGMSKIANGLEDDKCDFQQ